MKFYHIADVHLGAVPDGCAPWSRARGEEIFDSFVRLIDQVRLEKIELLLIAGDLFHHQPLLAELQEINGLFASLDHTEVVLIPGGRDALCADSAYRGFPFAENVHFLDGESQKKVSFLQWRTVVYGAELPSAEELSRDGAEFSILLRHSEPECEADWEEELSALKSSPVSYIALGGGHQPKIWQAGRILTAGALEPVSREDLGEHGFVEGAYRDGQLTVWQVPFALRSYRQLIFFSDQSTTERGLLSQLEEEIEARGVRDIYCVRIQGIRKPGIEFHPEHFAKAGNIAEVLDLSEPAFDLERLKREHGRDLIGRYIAYFEQSGEEEISRKALFRGLLALMGAEE